MSIRKRPNGKWQVDIVHPDIDRRGNRLRKSGFRTRRDARNYEARIRADLAAGTYAKKRAEEKARMTFNEWWPRYLAHAETINRASSLSAKKSYWRNHVMPQFGKLDITEFGQRQANELSVTMQQKGLTKLSVNHVLNFVQHMLTVAHEYELIDEAPKFRKHTVSEKKRKVSWFTPNELDELLSVAEEAGGGLAVLLGLRTGMRKGELRALKWGDVNLDRRQITVCRSVVHTAHPSRDVWQESTKGKRDRVIPIADDLHTALRGEVRQLHNPFVLTGRGERGEIAHQELRNIGNAINRNLDAKFTWHKLRHTFASQLIANGVPMNVVQQLGGWRNIKTLMRYAHLAPGHDALAAAVATLTEYGTSTAQSNSGIA